MQRVSRIMRIVAALVAAIAAAGAVTAAPAIASRQADSTSSIPRTCHAWRHSIGEYVAEDAYTNRSLAWTTENAENYPVYLGRYTGSLIQCWRGVGGFGNAEFELQLADSGLCLRVYNGSTSAGAYMDLYSCLSYTSELFTQLLYNGRAMYENVKSHLCVTADVGITSGSTLDQERCSDYDNSQSWWINSHP